MHHVFGLAVDMEKSFGEKIVLLNRFIFLFSNHDHKGRTERDLLLIRTILVHQRTKSASVLNFTASCFLPFRTSMLFHFRFDTELLKEYVQHFQNDL